MLLVVAWWWGRQRERGRLLFRDGDISLIGLVRGAASVNFECRIGREGSLG